MTRKAQLLQGRNDKKTTHMAQVEKAHAKGESAKSNICADFTLVKMTVQQKNRTPKITVPQNRTQQMRVPQKNRTPQTRGLHIALHPFG